MKKSTIVFVKIIIIFLILYKNNSFAQPSDYAYYKYSFIALPKQDSLYEKNKFRESINYILQKKDFLLNISTASYYLLAQNYSRLQNKDSAFYYLNLYIDGKAKDYRSIYVEEDFDILRRNKKEWKYLTDKIENIFLLELDSLNNKEYAISLFRLDIEENRYGIFLDISCRNKEKPTLEEKIKHHNEQKKQFKKLIKKYGFPTISLVGKSASMFAFYILQHSSIELKYYKMAKKAFENNDFSPQFFALLTDKWLLQKHKKQIYGTQFIQKIGVDFSTLHDVEDFSTLNERRAKIGLSTIEEYAKKINGIIPESYYKELNEEDSNNNRK